MFPAAVNTVRYGMLEPILLSVLFLSQRRLSHDSVPANWWLSLLGESFDPLLTRCKLLSTHSQEAPVVLTFSTPNQDVVKAADDLQ